MTIPALKTTVSATPILGPVVSGWSCFNDHVWIKKKSKCLALNHHAITADQLQAQQSH